MLICVLNQGKAQEVLVSFVIVCMFVHCGVVVVCESSCSSVCFGLVFHKVLFTVLVFWHWGMMN